MKLSPREVDKLLLHNAGFLAQKRLASGLRLNYTEAVALIASQVGSFYLAAINSHSFDCPPRIFYELGCGLYSLSKSCYSTVQSLMDEENSLVVQILMLFVFPSE